jgi:hypothetical protein
MKVTFAPSKYVHIHLGHEIAECADFRILGGGDREAIDIAKGQTDVAWGFWAGKGVPKGQRSRKERSIVVVKVIYGITRRDREGAQLWTRNKRGGETTRRRAGRVGNPTQSGRSGGRRRGQPSWWSTRGRDRASMERERKLNIEGGVTADRCCT